MMDKLLDVVEERIQVQIEKDYDKKVEIFLGKIKQELMTKKAVVVSGIMSSFKITMTEDIHSPELNITIKL